MKDTTRTTNSIRNSKKSLDKPAESLNVSVQINQDFNNYCPHSISYSQVIKGNDAAHRIELYQTFFQMCINADPKLRKWINKVDQKGLPGLMTQGYCPPPRQSIDQSMPTKRSSGVFDRMSGSVSTLFRKATASVPPRPSGPKSTVDPSPKPSSSRFLASSFGQLGFSRSTSRVPSKSESSSSKSYQNTHSHTKSSMDDERLRTMRFSFSTCSRKEKSSSHSHNKSPNTFGHSSANFLSCLKFQDARIPGDLKDKHFLHSATKPSKKQKSASINWGRGKRGNHGLNEASKSQCLHTTPIIEIQRIWTQNSDPMGSVKQDYKDLCTHDPVVATIHMPHDEQNNKSRRSFLKERRLPLPSHLLYVRNSAPT
ncbi:hypothetical protein J3Q64DRAFT_1758024 [Phycomyces blakesleeanus]|uniref:Uncharacterized protein n=2 Tax=Phycomyces blakesleeanus TaxID=4837 RepID=A0A162TRX5_PHYB8|nr:hypothetical protein PHYBLDRAFT_66752 [Phycomyces blakesleeanus NRRL 1555(-)]OAD69283.1 hypothetical protein PHYBLDRAFT_66752 [Phycomyces blakesleeanus NRRL 1555(-)]|eukprot:XP_018287323.1 hypothetical protein PHYBLDRAFT_66752 [Phycomyces blakesleeanus NRRL 1555(-)]